LFDSVVAAEQLIHQLENADEKEKAKLYDGVLGALWDATLIAQSDISVGDEGLALAKGYVNYTRLDKTIERTLILIEEAKGKVSSAGGKPEHVVKLYDTILLVFHVFNSSRV
jgi:hypothetical protein